MAEVREKAQELLDALKTERDEIRLQLKLASADARDRITQEWSELEIKFNTLKDETGRINQDVRQAAQRVGGEVKDVGEELGEAGGKLWQELRDGYQKLRQHLK